MHTIMHDTGNFTFPCHPDQMITDTPATMSSSTRQLRKIMIERIVELSKTYDQNTIDANVYADVAPNRRIIGMESMGIHADASDVNLCRGRRVPIGQLTMSAWTNMCIGPAIKHKHRYRS